MYEPVLPAREPPASPRLDSRVPGSRGPQGPCPAPPRSPSRSAQPLPPPRRLGRPRSPFLAVSGFSNCPPDQAARARAHPLRGEIRRVQPRRAQPHRQVGSPFSPVGWRISAAAPVSPRWRLGAATPGRRIPRGTDSRREAAALLPVPGRRGRLHHPQSPPRVSFPPAIARTRIPVRGAESLRPCARALSLHIGLSLSLQKRGLYRFTPRCHRRQTVMKSKENQLPDWRWGRDSASACARRRAARCNCCRQRALGVGRRGSRV